MSTPPDPSSNPTPSPLPKPAPEPDSITVPTYSSWFRWDGIHEVEYKHLPEFFFTKHKSHPSKTPTLYKYYRNAIINSYRAHPGKKLAFTEARRTIVGDVGPIRRVFDFLETWGLVNYTPPSGKQAIRWEEKEKEREAKATASSAAAAANAAAFVAAVGGTSAVGGGGEGGDGGRRLRKLCSGCKTLCTIACFVSDKYDLVLCARCYVRGNYRVGVSSTEFRRVEISEPAKTQWTEKETLHLLEAVMHYGDDWKRVAEHVGGRSEKDCVARFIKLPFGEQFVEPAELSEEESVSCQIKDQSNAESGAEPAGKRLRLTPLADASNPIMAQAAFLSALAGVDVSEAAARAAVTTLYDVDHLRNRDSGQSQAHPTKEQEPAAASNGNSSSCAPEEARVDAEFQLKQEEDEYLKSISTITQVKIREILDKIARFEDMDLHMEREWRQYYQMSHQLFLDKLTLSIRKTATAKSAENVTEEKVRTELTSSS